MENEPNLTPAPQPLILDTNIVLDLLLFGDAAMAELQRQLQTAVADAQRWRWIATAPMRDELAHVLAYAHLQPRLAFYGHTPQAILARFDAAVQQVPVAAPTPIRCKDGDDQKFIDLAVAHQAVLISKDKAVLKLRRRLARAGVWVGPTVAAAQETAMRAQQLG